MTSFWLQLRAPYRSLTHNNTCKNLPWGDRVSQGMIILRKNLWREIYVSVLNYSRITRNGGYHSLLAVAVLRLTYSMLQPNLNPENSSVSFKTKVLFTNRQVTKSNCVNLTGFGLRQNVKVLKTTQSLLWYQRTAVLLTYYHGINVPYKLLNSSRPHCYSRGS